MQQRTSLSPLLFLKTISWMASHEAQEGERWQDRNYFVLVAIKPQANLMSIETSPKPTERTVRMITAGRKRARSTDTTATFFARVATYVRDARVRRGAGAHHSVNEPANKRDNNATFPECFEFAIYISLDSETEILERLSLMSQAEETLQVEPDKSAEWDFECVWRRLVNQEFKSLKEAHRYSYMAGRGAQKFELNTKPTEQKEEPQ